MRRVLPEACEFFGADPIHVGSAAIRKFQHVNEALYESIGKFYHIAIGSKTESSETIVLVGVFAPSHLLRGPSTHGKLRGENERGHDDAEQAL